MKEKIIAAFKAKYPGINLSKTRLAAIATKIELKVIDDETKIDAALAAMDDAYAFADIAKDDDKIRTLEAKVKPPKTEETPAEKLAREKAEAAAKDPVPDDAPAWAKALIEQNKTLAQDLAVIKGEKVATTIKGKIAEAVKDVPVAFWDEWKLPDNEEEIPAFTEKVTTKFAALNQERTDQGLGFLSAPKAGGPGGGVAKTVSPEVKAFVEKQAAATPKVTA